MKQMSSIKNKEFSIFYFTADELRAAGFTLVGKNVRVSRKSSLYAISGRIGSNVRIDDFCILKGNLEIGNYVHICAYCSISGVGGTVKIGNFATLANRVSVYTGSDDYRANMLSSSTVPEQFVTTIKGNVIFGQAALVGAHSIVLPGAAIGNAASVGALCIVRGRVAPGVIMTSSSAKLEFRGKRNVKKILSIAKRVNNGR